MLRFIWLKIYFLSLILINPGQAFSQNGVADTTGIASLFRNAVNLYHQFLAPETGLYNGSEYAYNAYYPFIINDGDPFFKSPDFDTGAVVYNNILYEKVSLLFDVVKGELLTHDPTNNYILRLNTERITWFTIWGHTFIRLIRDSAKSSPVHTGFYDLLYNGNTVLYKKDTKTFKENTASFQGLNIYASESAGYYIKKDNQYYTIKNKKSLLLIMKDKKKEVTQFIKRNKLNLGKNEEYALMKIIAYYDGINNNTNANN